MKGTWIGAKDEWILDMLARLMIVQNAIGDKTLKIYERLGGWRYRSGNYLHLYND